MVILFIFLAKFGASVILNVSSIYTNEAFPTALRGRSTAICSFVGKFGGIFAPMIVELSNKIPIVSASSCFVALGSLMFLSNETKNVEFYDEKEEQVNIDNEELKEKLLN